MACVTQESRVDDQRFSVERMSSQARGDATQGKGRKQGVNGVVRGCRRGRDSASSNSEAVARPYGGFHPSSLRPLQLPFHNLLLGTYIPA